eukprot:jgi/Mesvir1/14647/Mv05317-RA.1
MATRLPDRETKRWMERFHAMRQGGELRYADEAHKNFCEKGVPLGRKPVVEYRTISLPYPKLVDRHTGVPLSDFARKLAWEPTSANAVEFRTFKHELLEPTMRDVAGYIWGPVADLVDMEWYARCLDYLKRLPQLDLIALSDYTHEAYEYTNAKDGALGKKLQGERDFELAEGADGHYRAFFKNANPLWTSLVRMIAEGRLDNLDPRKICHAPANLDELRRAVTAHLGERDKMTDADMQVDARLRHALTNLETWRDVLATIAALDHRLMDVIFVLAKWVYKYLKVPFQKDVAIRYKEDFRRVMTGAPRLTRETIVYRGVGNAYYLKKTDGAVRDAFRNEFPVSTSINPAVSLEFMSYSNSKCCFKIIHLMPGTPALCAWPFAETGYQAEIILPAGTTYMIRSHAQRNLVGEVPRFSPLHVVPDEVCPGRVLKERKNEDQPVVFPKRWVTEIYVDGSDLPAEGSNATAGRKRTEREPDAPAPPAPSAPAHAYGEPPPKQRSAETPALAPSRPGASYAP